MLKEPQICFAVVEHLVVACDTAIGSVSIKCGATSGTVMEQPTQNILEV